jgi:ribonuclease HI
MKAKLHTDGGSRGNPGPSASAFILSNTDGEVIETGGKYIGNETNNVAEYTGLIMGLMAARKKGVTELYVISDSQLMVRQIQGVYKVKDLKLRELFDMVQTVSALFDRIEFISVPREENKLVDELVNLYLDQSLQKN